MKSRVGEVWQANFNGYPITGRITKSTKIFDRYRYYPDDDKYTVWVHHVKILQSEEPKHIGKTHKWKESGCAFECWMKQIKPVSWIITPI